MMNSKKGRRVDVQGEGETEKSRSWPGPCTNVAGDKEKVRPEVEKLAWATSVETKEQGSEIYKEV